MTTLVEELERLREWAEDAVRQAFNEGAEWQKQGRPGRYTDVVQAAMAPQLQALAALKRAEPAADVAGLCERLREKARSASEVSKMLAEAKTARQADRDDYPEMAGVGYSWAKPEEMTEWEAAAALTSLSAQLAEARELLRQAMNALGTVDKNDPRECIADNGMTVWDGMQAESWRLWPKYRAFLARQDQGK